MKKVLLTIFIFSICLALSLFLARGKIQDYMAYRLIGPASYFDLDEIKDPSTLDIKIAQNEIVDSQSRPGEKVRVIKLSFTSQNWHGSTWRHPATIYVPFDYQGDGNVGIIATNRSFQGPSKTQSQTTQPAKLNAESYPEHLRHLYNRQTIPGSELNTEAEYAEGTALDLNIPIMIFPNPPTLIFNKDESDLMGYAMQMAIKTMDLSWAGYLPIATSYLRAITVLSSIEEIKAKKAVIMGCSKRGFAASIATGVGDERLAGIMGTCYYGGNILYDIMTKYASFGSGVGGPPVEKEGPAFQPAEKLLAQVNGPAGNLGTMAFDPYIWKKKITTPYFIALGTNDEFYGLGAPNGMMSELEGDKAFLYVDNLRHTWVSTKHLHAWRSWLGHVFYGRELPKIKVDAEENGSIVSVSADVSSPNTLKNVRLFYSVNRSLDWRSAQWEAKSMEWVGGRYQADLEKITGKHLAYYVEVEDFHNKGGIGYLSSLVQIDRASWNEKNINPNL
jgi:PhoPQ-activated pathogenicity-related protein